MQKLKHTGIFFGLLFLSATTFGQAHEPFSGEPAKVTGAHKNTFYLLFTGVNTSLNYGRANASLADYKKQTQGIQAGFSWEAGICNRFSLVTELYFMMKGGKLTTDNPFTAGKTSFRFYTLELPVLARYRIGNWYLNAGPSLAYTLSGTQKINDLSSHISFDQGTGSYKRFDAGFQFGGGVSFRIKQKPISLDLRYCYGLTNISSDKEIYTRCLNLSVQYSLMRKSHPHTDQKSY